MKLRERVKSVLSAAQELVVRHSPLPRPQEAAKSRVEVISTIAVQVIALAVLYTTVDSTLKPIFTEPRPLPIRPVGPQPGMRFELDEKTRHEIFAELAAAEEAERKRNIEQNTWQGHLWSREDDRGVVERNLAKAIATRRNISLTQVFLVLDEGIHDHWPGPDGKPLPATAEPLNLRVGW
jgi:hypothetical protein